VGVVGAYIALESILDLDECLSGLKDKDVEEIIRAVREQIVEFPREHYSPDITMLALKYNG
jgi:serine phosphatase RsbU (regulator of sigma subunit)